MKLCVFPNDPLVSYYNKGEIKERYFNPQNIFDEIELISFIEKDIDEDKVKSIVGNAKFKIHSVGKVSFSNKGSTKKKILKLVKSINPDIIRAYNPLLQGWIAAFCSQKLKIPFFVSIHVQYDGLRKIVKNKNFKKYLALKYSRKFIEPYTLSQAEKITAVYKIIDPYVFDICKKHPEILYNRIDLKRFQNGKKILKYEKPLVISVGRLTAQKNHDIIIKSVKDLDVYLLIIGTGELKDSLKELVDEMKISEKVIFKDSVLNEQIQNYYKSANVFALAYDPNVEGLPIPVLEALASNLPVVIPHPISEYSDGLEGAVAFCDLNYKSFESHIRKIIEDEEYTEKLRKIGIKKVQQFDEERTENREAEIYKELLRSKKIGLIK